MELLSKLSRSSVKNSVVSGFRVEEDKNFADISPFDKYEQVSSLGGVTPKRYPTMSTQFSTYREVILGLLHEHAIGVFKLSGFGKVQ